MGTKLHWTKKMTTDGRVIIMTMYCWVCNIIGVIFVAIIPQKRGKGNRAI